MALEWRDVTIFCLLARDEREAQYINGDRSDWHRGRYVAYKLAAEHMAVCMGRTREEVQTILDEGRVMPIAAAAEDIPSVERSRRISNL